MIANKIILGTVQFGLDYGINNKDGKPSSLKISKILDYAKSQGIEYLDTAEAYGDSQTQIGKYHIDSDTKFKIITKYSSSITNLPESIIDRVRNDISVLNVDSLYGYMFHSFNDFIARIDLFKDDLLFLKKNGELNKLGVSVYTNEEMNRVLEYECVDLIQLPFNLLDNYSQRGSLLRKAKEKGIEIHTRSSFLQGLFFKSLESIPKKLSPLLSYMNELKKMNIDMNKLALSYVNQQKYIDKVLIGVDNIEQLISNIASLEYKLSDANIEKINNLYVKERDLLNPTNWS